MIGKTAIPWMSFEMDFLGIYATYESLVPQFIVLTVIVISSVMYARKNKKRLAELT